MRDRKEPVIQNLTYLQLHAPLHLSCSFSHPQLLCGEGQVTPGDSVSSISCKAVNCIFALLSSQGTGSLHSHWAQRASLFCTAAHPKTSQCCLLSPAKTNSRRNSGKLTPKRPNSTLLFQASLAGGSALEAFSAMHGERCLIRNLQLCFAPATGLPRAATY